MTDRIIRKLTTILAADAEQFSTAMTTDEVGTFTELQAARDVFFKLIDRHGGRVANTAGDGLIADFPSVVEAVQCAIEVQQELAAKDTALSFRIGVHLGDVICDGEDLIGEGVNLAARLQTMSEPGGVLISQQVYDHVKNKLTIGFEDLGPQRPKNLTEDVTVYRISMGAPRPSRPTRAPFSEAERSSQTARVWQDPDPFEGAPERQYYAADTEEEDTGPLKGMDKLAGRRLPLDKVSRRLIGAAGVMVFLDIFTDRGLWAHWPILIFALIIGLREGQRITGRSEIASIPIKLWFIGGFLILVNLFSQSPPWSIWAVGGMFLFSFLRRRKSQVE